MNYLHQRQRFTSLAAISLIALVALSLMVLLVKPRNAAAQTGGYAITLSSLAGPWELATSVMGSGCGQGTEVAHLTLNANGQGTMTTQFHNGCGDGTGSGTFVITSLNPDGSGTAGYFSCGPGCGFNLTIQVMRGSQLFSYIDVDPANPGNFISGTAIRVNRP